MPHATRHALVLLLGRRLRGQVLQRFRRRVPQERGGLGGQRAHVLDHHVLGQDVVGEGLCTLPYGLGRGVVGRVER